MQGTTWSGQKLSQSQNKGKVDMIRRELHKQDQSRIYPPRMQIGLVPEFRTVVRGRKSWDVCLER